MNKTTYLALTLGPIHKTVLRQRKTRAVFTASYFFSYTMKKIMEKLLESGIETKQIVMPSPHYLQQQDYIHPGCGLYTDRLVMVGKDDGDFQKLTDACEAALKHLAKKLNSRSTKFTEKKILSYLKQYMQLYCLEIKLEKGEKTINEINQALDNLELQSNFPYDADEDYLQEFFNRIDGHFLLEDAFGKSDKKQRFDSLVEIATRGLSRIATGVQKEKYETLLQQSYQEEEGEEGLFAELQTLFQDDLQPYHRYVAIIYADADSLGKYVENLKADETELLRVSNQLMELGKAAKKAIDNYGGAPVYIGGDDLLFFAPAVSLNNEKMDVNGQLQKEQVFDLLADLEQLFYEQFRPEDGSPTLSFGVCLFYYKFPLNEALKIAQDLLLYEAKNKKHHPDKNAIAFRLMKHSGQFFEAGIDKVRPIVQTGGQLFNIQTTSVHYLFYQLLKEQISGDNFMNSLAHGIGFFQDLLGNLIIGKEGKDLAGVQHLFDNTFDESIHRQNRKFINAVAQYTIAVFEEIHANYFDEPKDKQPFITKNKKAIATIHATLRYINFVKEKTNSYALQN